MREVVLREPLATLWQGEDVFARVGDLKGRVVREKEGRRTSRCAIGGRYYFLKHHTGVGWREILKNLLQLRLPVVDASNEWRAMNRLAELDIGTLEPVAWGRRGRDPARRESFLITRERREVETLEDLTRDWPVAPPPPAFRRAIIHRVAAISRRLHGAGINHRDLYLCHFWLDTSRGDPLALSPETLHLFLVDLHRAQIRRRVPKRWRVKDLASLYFSALDAGLTRRDVLRFLRVYFPGSLRRTLRGERLLLRRVAARARQLYRRDTGREPRLPL